MKYVKLFENWLNEADGGGVKPFDPNNPGATLVVDITNKDLTKDPKVASGVLTSVFNRMIAKKDEPGVEEKVIVEPFKIVTNNSIKKPYHFSITSLTGSDELYLVNYSANNRGFDDILNGHAENKTPILMVRANDFKLPEDDKPLKLNSSCTLLIPENVLGFGIKDKEHFAMDTRLYFMDKQFIPTKDKDVSLSSILLAYSEFKPNQDSLVSGGLPDGKSISNIAKALGYEVPDNYAPGQGVEKKKA